MCVLKSPTFVKEFEFVVKNFTTKRTPGPTVFGDDSSKHTSWRNINPTLTSSENIKGKNTS